jgi:hypothetical protein
MRTAAVRPAVRRTKVFSAARVAAPLVRNRKARAAVPKAARRAVADHREADRKAVVGHKAVADHKAAAGRRVAVAQQVAAVVPRVAAARPVVAQQVACPMLEAVPLAVVRADIPLRVVARAVAAAVE